MFHGLKGPQSGRTSRTQAESMGTESSGFIAEMPYSTHGGHPITPQMPDTRYAAAQVKPPMSGGAPVDVKTPFVLK